MSESVANYRIPVGSSGRRASGWWGMMTLIVTEGSLFGFLLFSYYYLAVQHGSEWLPSPLPGFRLSLPNTVLLLASSYVAWRGERAVRRGSSPLRSAAWLAIAAVMGAIFVFVQTLEWATKTFTPMTSSYGSLYFTITGFHMAHVIAGIAILLVLAVWSALGYFDRVRNAPVSIGVIYWHFVDVVWLAVFFSIYVTPRLDVG